MELTVYNFFIMYLLVLIAYRGNYKPWEGVICSIITFVIAAILGIADSFLK